MRLSGLLGVRSYGDWPPKKTAKQSPEINSRCLVRSLIFLCPLLFYGSTQAQVERQPSPAAIKFIADGATYALRNCDFPVHACNGRPLSVLKSSIGYSTDRKRLVEEYAMVGMKAKIIYSSMERTALYDLASVEVSSDTWRSIQGLGPSVARSHVVNVLGQPTTQERSCDQYSDGHDSVSFCYRNNLVKVVRWEFFAE